MSGDLAFSRREEMLERFRQKYTPAQRARFCRIKAASLSRRAKKASDPREIIRLEDLSRLMIRKAIELEQAH